MTVEAIECADESPRTPKLETLVAKYGVRKNRGARPQPPLQRLPRGRTSSRCETRGERHGGSRSSDGDTDP